MTAPSSRVLRLKRRAFTGASAVATMLSRSTTMLVMSASCPLGLARGKGMPAAGEFVGGRSEEHTFELQSLMRISYAVSCLQIQTPFNIYSLTIFHIPHDQFSSI